MKVLSKREVKNLLKSFGINYQGKDIFIEQNKKVYLVSKDIQKINQTNYKIITQGLYIGKLEKQGFRLTIEGAQLFQPTENVLEIKDLNWLKGKDIELKPSALLKASEQPHHAQKFTGFVAIKYKTDFLGSGLYNKGKILNFVPKIRRI